MPKEIIKRDGSVEAWDGEKIANAIRKGFNAAGLRCNGIANLITTNVEDEIDTMDLPVEGRIELEPVQDLILKHLAEGGHDKVAALYAMYRLQRAKLREATAVTADINRVIDDYLGGADWRTAENANMKHSYQGLILHASGAAQARYCLDKYNPAIKDAHINGYFHIHDLSMGLTGYCAGWSIADLLLEGFECEDHPAAGPAKHFDTALGQMNNFLGTLQNEWSGAQAFNNVDTYLAPFVRADVESALKQHNIQQKKKFGENAQLLTELSDEYVYNNIVKQKMQSFIHNINTTSRWGGQSPFTNVSFDIVCPKSLANEPAIIGGKYHDTWKLGDFQKEADMINKAYAEVMLAGDNKGRTFSFPIPTYNCTADFDWEGEVGMTILKLTAKYGAPYFQNFIGSDLNPDDVRSMCPIHPDETVMVKSSRGVSVRRIEDIYKTQERAGTSYQVLYNGEWFDAKANQLPAEKVYRIVLENGVEIKLDGRHLQPHVRDDHYAVSRTDTLAVGDYLPFNKTLPYHADEASLRNLGFLIGAYVGDGSMHDGTLVFSLNKSSKMNVACRIALVAQLLGFTYTSSFEEDQALLTVRVKSHLGAASTWISQFVDGTTAHTKKLKSRIYDMHPTLAEGILEGWYATDGGNRGRIYTVSESLKESFCELCGFLGVGYDVSNSDTRDGRLGTSEVFTLKYHTRKNYRPSFFEYNDNHYVRISSIEEIDYTGNVYCFEVDNDDHLFQMASGLITHNCRLSLDLNEVRKATGGLFGAGNLTGSTGVVTLNLAKLGYLAKNDNEESLFALIDTYADLAKEALVWKREMLDYNFYKRKLYPWTRRYLKNGYKGHFNTIGVNAGHECCQNFFSDHAGIETEKGTELMKKVLTHLKTKIVEYQKETGYMFNLEATPAEGAGYRLARIDRAEFGDKIIQSGTEETPYYTNSTALPVDYTSDIFFALDHQNHLQPLYGGGTVFHSLVGESATDLNALKNFLLKAMRMTKLPYISFTPTFSVCPDCGYINGEHFDCPTCGNEAEVYSRIVGYFRPISRWNRGKAQEYKERVVFTNAIETK